MWNTIKMIFEGSNEIKREKMNTIYQELEIPNVKIHGDILKNFIFKKYLRFKEWGWKSNPVLKFKDTNSVNIR